VKEVFEDSTGNDDDNYKHCTALRYSIDHNSGSDSCPPWCCCCCYCSDSRRYNATMR